MIDKNNVILFQSYKPGNNQKNRKNLKLLIL